ncbi:DUF11 domain-containing protein [Planctomicrobium piriforme]|uniref:Conserved repeat domain-containing protein n=1 Tax=Planctomicrobium piriforme TaxID=1576369 RepID=A0A1I3IJ32_9PLAN|nr:DUF11 domain-containing protein [Planctomicrobium piriforme]SFI47922.1 conserved repeat domain-containing protein [Planctomicrobium piriforme]
MTRPQPKRSTRILLRAAGWSQAAALGLVICSSSCSSVSQYVKHTFGKEAEQPPVAQAGKDPKKSSDDVKHAYTSGKKDSTKVETLKSEEKAAQAGKAQPRTEASTAAKPAAPKTPAKPAEEKPDVLKLIAKGEDPFGASGVEQASAQAPATPEKPAADSISFDAEPRQPANAKFASATAECPPIADANCPPAGACPPGAACPPSAPCGARPFPGMETTADEYVCDGGDKGIPVHYEGPNRAGLGIEDTVAEFQDDAGNMHVKASTQACIYAPRFGEVRSATLPQEGLSIAKAQGHQDEMTAAGLNTKTVTGEKVQWDEPQGMLMRARPSEIDARTTDGQLNKAIAAESHVKLINAHEDIRFIQEGQFDKVNMAVIGLGVDAAQEWADGRRPIIIAQDEFGQILQGRYAAQDYTGVEDRRTPGDLKLIKVADKASAHPGEIVTFTIRFDNIGGKDLLKVRVVDNLSPRLEYVEGSINSNLDGQIDVSDNGAGGKLLTFEFDQPLKGKTGGFVSFQCRVR